MNATQDEKTWQNPFYTFAEELANSITHGIGVGLAVIGLVTLLILGILYSDWRQVLGFVVYGISLILLYLASTLYHGVQHPRAKQFLRLCDHTVIYVFIAGTYTPFLLAGMQGQAVWTMLAVVWLMAGAGILWKIFFLGRFEVLATLMYLLMGWMGVLAFRQFLMNVPPQAVTLLIAGGIVYTVGVIFYAWQRLPFNHAIWHLFVLGGSICHFAAVIFLIPI